jgi:putative ubiquitin-RnfH superfamily antitoxin RatB of RatAB toxin-antitoxin module
VRVQVALAWPERQFVVEIELPEGATAAEAIRASGLLARAPGLDTENLAVGIFGERVPLTERVSEGDRVEIYRPLSADPREVRRNRARRRGKA